MGNRPDGIYAVLQALTPVFLGLLGVIAMSLPIRLFEGYIPTPMIPLAIVYFWSLYGQENLPAFGVFLIGLFHDLISGGPIGVWPTIYLLVQYWVSGQREYFLGREPHVIWMGFGFAAIAASVLLWVEMCLMAGAWLTVWPLFWQSVMTIVLFPALLIAFKRFHERVVLV